MSSRYYKILEKDGISSKIPPEYNERLKNWAQNQEQIFNIFIIFILGQKKEYIIPELLKKQEEGYNFSPYNDPEIFYFKFKPFVQPLGKIYFRDMKVTDSDPETDRKTQKKKGKGTQTKKIKGSKRSKTRRNAKGGFLFMLEDKGKEAITGDDIKEVLDKYTEALDTLYYTQFARDSTIGGEGEPSDIANPFTGLYVMMSLSRKQFQSAAYPLVGKAQKLLSDPMDWYDYYTLYNLYKPEYDKSEKKAYKKAMENIKSQPNEEKMLSEPVDPI